MKNVKLQSSYFIFIFSFCILHFAFCILSLPAEFLGNIRSGLEEDILQDVA